MSNFTNIQFTLSSNHKYFIKLAHTGTMEIDRFNRYEENFLNSSRIISRAINQLEHANGNVDQIITASVEIEGELSEAEGFLRAMDIEFRSMSSMEKRAAQTKLNDYREEVKQLQSTYTASKLSAEAQAMKGGPSSRTRLLNSNQKLDSSTATLEKSRQILANTQQIGDTVLTDLETQKETLMDARSKVKETKDFTSEARRVLRMMGNRAIIHKIIVILIIIGLGAAIVATGYFGVTKKK